MATLALAAQSQAERAMINGFRFCVVLFWLQLRLLLIIITGWLWYRTFRAKNRLASELNEGAGWTRALIGAAEESTHGSLFDKDYLNFLDLAVRDEWRAAAHRRWCDARWFLLRTRTGSNIVLNVMLYGSGLVFLLMLFNLRV
jgi:hypothetical protein